MANTALSFISPVTSNAKLTKEIGEELLCVLAKIEKMTQSLILQNQNRLRPQNTPVVTPLSRLSNG